MTRYLSWGPCHHHVPGNAPPIALPVPVETNEEQPVFFFGLWSSLLVFSLTLLLAIAKRDLVGLTPVPHKRVIQILEEDKTLLDKTIDPLTKEVENMKQEWKDFINTKEVGSLAF
nr:hypothetical protein Iba_chr02fCG12540 [Ipomoea batatas]